MLTRFIASWRQTKMSGDSARLIEAGRVIHSRFEVQSCILPGTRNGHHPQTSLVLGGGAFDPAIQFQKVLIPKAINLRSAYARFWKAAL